MWIDSHCHLDAGEFAGESDAVAARARARGVELIVIPAVERANFGAVRELCARNANCRYTLGIHPMYVPRAKPEELDFLRETVAAAMRDANFIGIGEIGLDFFVPGLGEGEPRAKQEFFYREQLKLAREYGLPVLLHVRRSQDVILKYLRRIEVLGGIAHAFNGSFQQARHFIDLGFKLGFGGAMTFPRSLQIRRLAAELPPQALVLETDAPDIPPAWVHPGRNSPEELPRIGQVLAELRGIAMAEAAAVTSENVRAVLPRLHPVS